MTKESVSILGIKLTLIKDESELKDIL